MGVSFVDENIYMYHNNYVRGREFKEYRAKEMRSLITDHDKEYFKNKIYRLFEEFSNTDGLKPEVWDLYANFVEEVEINRQKRTVEEICKVYKDITEIRLKEMRTLMLNEWEKDIKVRDIIKTVIKATRLVVAKITNDSGYMNDKILYLNSIEAKITNEEEKEKKEKEEKK